MGNTPISSHLPQLDERQVRAYLEDIRSAANADSLSFTVISSDSGETIADQVADTLTIAGGSGLTTSIAGDTVTIDGIDASTTAKGVAQFSSSDFVTTAGTIGLVSRLPTVAEVGGTLGDALSVNKDGEWGVADILTVNAKEYGFVAGDNTFDNALIWNSFLANETINYLYFPPGQYHFLSRPDPIERTMHIFGSSYSTTILTRGYQPSSGDVFIDFQKAKGSHFYDLTLWAGVGTTLGVALGATAQADGDSNFSNFRRLNITTGTGTWEIGIYLDGSIRDGSSPEGIRDMLVSEVFIFACTVASFKGHTVHGAFVSGMFFQAGGSSNDIIFTATVKGRTDGVTFYTTAGIGDLNITNLGVCNFYYLSASSITNSSSSANLYGPAIDLHTGDISCNSFLQVRGVAANAGRVILGEDSDNGAEQLTLSAAAAMSASFTLRLPAADGAANEAMVTDGSGTLSFSGHDGLAGFVANEHIDWTSASSAFSTSGTIDCTGTEAIKIPSGTTAQRPGTPLDGDLRVNTTAATTEVYRSSAWKDLESGGGSGDWVKVASTVAADDATVEFTVSSSTYEAYKIVITGILPENDGVGFWMRMSIDGGSTFEAGASDYGWVFVPVKMQTSVSIALAGVGDDADSEIEISPLASLPQGNNTDEEAFWEITLFSPRLASVDRVIQWFGNTAFTDASKWYNFGTGRLYDESNVEAIQFLYSSGNIEKGNFVLYGMTA